MRAVSLPLPRSAATQRIGVEHELCLWHGAERVDFRKLITRLAGGIRPLDPGDPRARRLPSGVALTADGWEAELATPPVPVDSSAPVRIDELLRTERTELRKLSTSYGVTRVSGFSIHLNISVPDHHAVEIARAFVDHCLVALATVVEPVTTHGLLVRPRRGRLEIGGEYVEGAQPGGRADPARRVCPRASRRDHPRLCPGTGSVGRAREVRVVRSAGGPARRRRTRRGVVMGQALGSPRGPGPEPGRRTRRRGPRELRDGIHAETEWMTWQHAVWLFRDAEGRECRAVVPADRERDFLNNLDSGQLDPVVSRMLRRTLLRRRLLVNAQIDGGGLWHDVRPGALVPAERQADGTVPRVSVGAARRAHLRTRRPAWS